MTELIPSHGSCDLLAKHAGPVFSFYCRDYSNLLLFLRNGTILLRLPVLCKNDKWDALIWIILFLHNGTIFLRLPCLCKNDKLTIVKLSSKLIRVFIGGVLSLTLFALGLDLLFFRSLIQSSKPCTFWLLG